MKSTPRSPRMTAPRGPEGLLRCGSVTQRRLSALLDDLGERRVRVHLVREFLGGALQAQFP
jgi:hypothetical protein